MASRCSYLSGGKTANGVSKHRLKAFVKVPQEKLALVIIKRFLLCLAQQLTYSLQLFISKNKVQGNSNFLALRKERVTQGDTTSPFLLNLTIDTLRKPLHEKYRFCVGLTFCDHLILLAKTEGFMQELLDICSVWTVSYLINWSTSKCVSISEEESSFSLSAVKLPIVIMLTTLVSYFTPVVYQIRYR